MFHLQVSNLTLKSLEGATSADLAEIEQIVKERMVRNNNSFSSFLFNYFALLHDLTRTVEYHLFTYVCL